MTQIDHRALMAEMNVEIADERFATRTHGKRATYDVGCRGPLCRKALRDAARRTYAERSPGTMKPRGTRSRLLDIYIERFAKRYYAERTLARAS